MSDAFSVKYRCELKLEACVIAEDLIFKYSVPTTEMGVIRKNYSTYCSVLDFTGLWPYNESIPSKIHRIVISLLTLCCVVVQVSSITHVEATLQNLITMLSCTCPLLLFVIRYVGFIYNFPLTRCFFENMESDYEMLEDPMEVQILLRNIKKSRRIVYMFLGVAVIAIFAVVVLLLIPTVLHLNYQLRIMHVLGFYFSERDNRTDLICVHFSLTTVLGVLTIACTEAAFAVFSFYLCGLFEIVGYRVRTTVENSAKSLTSGLIQLGPAVEMHHKAHGLITTMGTSFLVSYTVAILMVVVSFAVNLYHVFLSITENYSPDEIVVPVVVAGIHLFIIFLNNYSGQAVIDTSSQVFVDTYNSVWYRIPPNSQKMLLLLLLNSLNGAKINLVGLFVPGYEGFSMMISSSFSYFTVLLSV